MCVCMHVTCVLHVQAFKLNSDRPCISRKFSFFMITDHPVSLFPVKQEIGGHKPLSGAEACHGGKGTGFVGGMVLNQAWKPLQHAIWNLNSQ